MLKGEEGFVDTYTLFFLLFIPNRATIILEGQGVTV